MRRTRRIGVVEQPDGPDAGIVDQDVQPAELAWAVSIVLCRTAGIGDVAGDRISTRPPAAASGRPAPAVDLRAGRRAPPWPLAGRVPGPLPGRCRWRRRSRWRGCRECHVWTWLGAGLPRAIARIADFALPPRRRCGAASRPRRPSSRSGRGRLRGMRQ